MTPPEGEPLIGIVNHRSLSGNRPRCVGMFRRQLGLKASDYVTLTQYATEKVCGAQRAVERVANFVMRCFLNGIAYLLTCLRCQLLIRGESTTIESGRAPMASGDRKVSDDRILEGLVWLKSTGARFIAGKIASDVLLLENVIYHRLFYAVRRLLETANLKSVGWRVGNLMRRQQLTCLINNPVGICALQGPG